MNILNSIKTRKLTEAQENVLINFNQYLLSRGEVPTVVKAVDEDIKGFMLYKGGVAAIETDFEEYLQLLIEERVKIPKLKSVSDSLTKYYQFLGVKVPENSAVYRDILKSESLDVAREAVEESGVLETVILPYVLPLLGWIGILSKLRLLYLLIAGAIGLAGTAYVVEHPQTVQNITNTVREVITQQPQKETNQVATTQSVTQPGTTSIIERIIGGGTTQVIETSTSEIQRLNKEVTTLQSLINKLDTNIDKLIENDGTTQYQSVTQPSNIDAFLTLVSNLETQVNNLTQTSTFSVTNGSTTVLNFSDSTTLNVNGGLEVSDDVEVGNDLHVLGDLTVDQDTILNGNLDTEDVSVGGDIEVDGILRVQNRTDNPSDNTEGGLYFNTSNNQLYVNDGSNWNSVGTTYSVMTGGGLQLVNSQFGLLTCSSNEILKYLNGAWTCSADVGLGGGTFSSLTDVPSSYSGQGGKLVRVGTGETSLEFLNVSGWDQDSSDDLTTSTNFGGDVSGVYTNIQLGSGVVGASELASSGVTAGTYGTSTSIPVFTIDADGRITSAFNTSPVVGNNITSVGTITSGTWQASVIQVPYGGTGASTFTANGILYGNGTGAFQTVGVGTSGQVLTVNSSSQPVWASASSVFGGSFLQKTNNLNDLSSTAVARQNLGLGLFSTASNIDLSTQVTNVLGVTNGGIGLNSVTMGNLLYGNGTGALTALSIGTTSQILVSNGTVPTWADASTALSGSFWSLSGNAASETNFLGTTNTAPLFIGTSNQHRLSILGNGNVGVGITNPGSTFTVAGTSNLGGLAVSSSGSVTAGTWNAAVLTVPFGGTGASTLTSNAILYGNGTGAIQLSSGTANQILTVNGSSQPVWADASTIAGSFWLMSGNSNALSTSLIGTSDTAALRIGTSNLERMRITGDGKVGIGATSPSELLNVSSGGVVVDKPSISSVGSHNIGQAADIDVNKGFSYLAVGTSGLVIYDSTKKASPTPIARYDTTGTASGIDVNGNYAYLADAVDGLLIFDITNSSAPVLLSTYTYLTSLADVRVFGKYAYLSTADNGLYIIDVSNPNSPALASSYDIDTVNGVDVVGNYAYLAAGTTGLVVLDISDPYNPIFKGTYDTGNAKNLEVVGRYAYVADSTNGLVIVDVSNPTSPSLVSTTATGILSSVRIAGKYAYTGGSSSFRAVDISNPASPTIVTTITSTGAQRFKIVGKYAYIASLFTGYNILDLSGADISSISAGSIKSNYASVDGKLSVGNNANVGNGLNVGAGGISSNGAINVSLIGATNSSSEIGFNVRGNSANGALINISPTSTANYVFDVRSAGVSRLTVNAGGNVGIGTSNPSTFKLESAGSIGPSTNPQSVGLSLSTTQIVLPSTTEQNTAITIGADGYPVIAFRNTTDGDIMITKCNNSTCTLSSTTQVVDANNIGVEVSIAVGPDQTPVISARSITSLDLVVIKCAGSTCMTGVSTTVLSNGNNVGGSNSIAIGQDGLPVISYYDNTAGDLVVTKCGDSSCITGNSTTTIPDSDNVAVSTNIAIGSDGLPIITYRNVTDTDLMITKCGNNSCTVGNSTTQIVSTDDQALWSNIKIGNDGLPVIAYTDSTDSTIMVVKCGDSSCISNNTITKISSGDAIGSYLSMDLGVDGFPVISSYDSTNADPFIVKCGNAACSSGSIKTDISDSDNAGQFTSIVVAPDGLPIFTYHNATDADMAITKCSDVTCSLSTGYYYGGGYDIGSLGKYWNNVYGVNFWAKEGMAISNFDIAEDYQVEDSSIESGDIVAVQSTLHSTSQNVAIDKEKEGIIRKGNIEEKDRIIGVVSTKPGLRLTNFDSEDKSKQRAVALGGRVPVKISVASERIESGDYITISEEEGKGKKARGNGIVIGKALERWDPTNPKDKIMIFVELKYHNDNLTQSIVDTDDLKEIAGEIEVQGTNNKVKLGFNNTSDFITFESDLNIEGEVSIGTTKVTKDLTVAGDISNLFGSVLLQNGKVELKEDGSLVTEGKVIAKGNVAGSSVVITNKDDENKTIGTSIIKRGEDKVFVKTKSINENSKVLLTSKNKERYPTISQKKVGEGFEVSIEMPMDSDIEFDWVIVDTTIPELKNN